MSMVLRRKMGSMLRLRGWHVGKAKDTHAAKAKDDKR